MPVQSRERVTYVGFAMIEQIVGLLLDRIDDGSIFDDDGFQAFDTNVLQATQTFNRVEHIDDTIETFAECIEFAEDVVLTRSADRSVSVRRTLGSRSLASLPRAAIRNHHTWNSTVVRWLILAVFLWSCGSKPGILCSVSCSHWFDWPDQVCRKQSHQHCSFKCTRKKILLTLECPKDENCRSWCNACMCWSSDWWFWRTVKSFVRKNCSTARCCESCGSHSSNLEYFQQWHSRMNSQAWRRRTESRWVVPDYSCRVCWRTCLRCTDIARCLSLRWQRRWCEHPTGNELSSRARYVWHLLDLSIDWSIWIWPIGEHQRQHGIEEIWFARGDCWRSPFVVSNE